MIGLVFAPMLLAQQAVAEAPLAPSPAPFASKTFVVEYPYTVAPYVDDYYNCLRSRDVRIGKESSFEAEYRKAIPQCEKVEAESLESSLEVLARSTRKDITPEGMVQVFEQIRMIHVQRGRVLDGIIDESLGDAPYTQQVSEDGRADGVVTANAEETPETQAPTAPVTEASTQ